MDSGDRAISLLNGGVSTQVAYLPREFHEVEVIVESEISGIWRATNDDLQGPSGGIAYRATKNRHDKITTIKGPEWDQSFHGSHEGDGWVRVLIPAQAVEEPKKQQTLDEVEEKMFNLHDSLSHFVIRLSRLCNIQGAVAKKHEQNGAVSKQKEQLQQDCEEQLRRCLHALEQQKKHAGLVASAFPIGSHVEAIADFTGNSTGELRRTVKKGSHGVIRREDADGDALIDFFVKGQSGATFPQWVLRKNLFRFVKGDSSFVPYEHHAQLQRESEERLQNKQRGVQICTTHGNQKVHFEKPPQWPFTAK
jgi:hypothetical protein